jgi:hypothetical protein
MDFPVVSFSQSLIETLATAWLTDSTVFSLSSRPGRVLPLEQPKKISVVGKSQAGDRKPGEE